MQSALAHAAEPDPCGIEITDIWVAGGTYRPAVCDPLPCDSASPERAESFVIPAGLGIYGGFPPDGGDGTFAARAPWTYTTTLSGDLNGDDGADFVNNDENSYHVLRGDYAVETRVIDGFTITGGNANGAFPDTVGAGILNPGLATISNCVFRANWAGGYGGAVYTNSDPSLVNSLFVRNHANTRGGAVYNVSGRPSITNCTFSDNTATSTGGAVESSGTPTTLTNCILWGNTPDQVYGNAALYHSDIEGGWSGSGSDNIPFDPEFFDPNGQDDIPGTEDDDYRLYASSPCIETGDTSAASGSTDLAGNPRLLDADGDDIADVDMGAYEFTCRRVDIPVPDPRVPDQGNGTRNRYLSFDAGGDDRQKAFRVTVIDVGMGPPQHPDFSCAEGEQWWVAEPVEVTEASCCNDPTPPPTFWAAGRICSTPYYTDWSVYGDVMHAYGPAVFPDTTYHIQAVDQACDPGEGNPFDESHLSAPLIVQTSIYGDAVGDCGPTPCTPPQGIVDWIDIDAVVEKFRNLPMAPQKARADLGPSDISEREPDRKIDFVDITAAVDAFRGNSYPYGDPCHEDNREEDLCSY